MIAFCQDKRRRDSVLQASNINGIDFLEVIGNPGCGRRLALTFLKDARGLGLAADNILLTGDTQIGIMGVGPAPDDPLTVLIDLDQTGDFSPYMLTLVKSNADYDPPTGIDSQLASVSFSFKAGCPTPADCLQQVCCPVSPLTAPDIHYLARDFDSFRQAILDRMAVLVPDWTENHIADPGIALVEALAYAADHISYQQDAINTEAYIGTARSRISLRRHARLVDYSIGEGANARAWVCLTASADNITIPSGTQIYPLVPGLPASITHTSNAIDRLINSPGPVFESLDSLVVYSEHNEIRFYTWGDSGCCLPIGATEATLVGTLDRLNPGDVLIFEEVKGPLTGDPADADPTHRCAVRLTSVRTQDNQGNNLTDPLNPPITVTSIAWQEADALPFPLCLSSTTDSDHGSQAITDVSLARGNVLPADQRQWVEAEDLQSVPAPPPAPLTGAGCNCAPVAGALAPRSRYEPTLANTPLTFAVPYDRTHERTQAASSFLTPDPSLATPQISLTSDKVDWQPFPDLLKLDDKTLGFVPEIERNGTVHLRFGDGSYGVAPIAGDTFTANYCIGNGAAGNVGRDALAHIIFDQAGVVTAVRNPLPAAGGTDPESMEHIRQYAPFNFQKQQRCVTADDYGSMAQTLPGVQEAKGTLRWTGSWYSAFVSVDPARTWTRAMQSSIKTGLDMLRMMGTDLVAEKAQFVGLRIGLEICVASGFFRSDVYTALWQLLVKGDPCVGTPGLLNGTNFSFGDTVYASKIVAAAQSVKGVGSVRVAKFERMDTPTPAGIAPPAQLTMGRLEIPRCDNDPNHADRGLLILTMDGGK